MEYGSSREFFSFSRNIFYFVVKVYKKQKRNRTKCTLRYCARYIPCGKENSVFDAVTVRLSRKQLVILPFPCHELFVSSELDEFAVFKNGYLTCGDRA